MSLTDMDTPPATPEPPAGFADRHRGAVALGLAGLLLGSWATGGLLAVVLATAGGVGVGVAVDHVRETDR